MAERGSFALGPRLDFQQLMIDAQHRWLRPAEICEILHNYQKFQITPEPPNRPPSGSLFLFDRKVLRYFRKDQHNWRKKRDGKTVKEAHEKLKVGSIDVLHCYYAHGEDNENFQRRCYWLLEQDFMHIVFVHYLEVKGNKTNIGGIKATADIISNFQDSQSSSGLLTSHSKTYSGNTVSSPASTLTSLCEDADSEDVCQGNSALQTFLEVSRMRNGPSVDNISSNLSTSHLLDPTFGYHHEGQPSIMGVSELLHVQPNRHIDDGDYTRMNEDQRNHHTAIEGDCWQQYPTEKLSYNENAVNLGSVGPLSGQSNLQTAFEDNDFQLSKWPADQTLDSKITYDLDPGLFEQRTLDSVSQIAPEAFYTSDQQSVHFASGLTESQWVHSNSGNGLPVEGISNYVFPPRKLLLDREEKMQKVDSFSKWISKELGDVGDLHVRSTSDITWSAVECGDLTYESSLSPSLSQDQLFSIIDYSPKWAYPDSDTEVFITGTFLKRQPEVTKIEWSCMFGELEVSAEVLADGVLCCSVPTHGVGLVPFYITCSNRVACSEVREFEYQEGSAKEVNVTDIYSSNGNELLLCFRLQKLLSLQSVGPRKNALEGDLEMRDLITKIMSLKEEENNYMTLEPRLENGFPVHELKAQSFLRLIKEKFFSWLLHKVTEDGKGPSALDDEGQGIIHLVAALGYDWSIKPIVAAGVSINFRDVNGWTALHWAAFCGRERTVAVLLSLGLDPGLLTDPSPEHPLGRTAADLASGNGHKGISGFLAETNLTDFLAKLSVEDADESGSNEVPGAKTVVTVAEKAATPVSDGDVPEVLSLKDSLNAVCNAKQAADRIHLVFRMQSFRRKQVEYGLDEYGTPDERAISFLAPKTRKPGQSDGRVYAAATQIQKKFRGYKKRKEFLIIRQRIIKIQAHVRGHQVRKQYRTIIWSVGILEKIILRWRRKGSGLRGFRQDNKESSPQVITSNEDDYDFLKEGRKQTEERLGKALTRVKSMVQYPEARDQYRRLLTVVEAIRETQACDMVLNSSEDVRDGEDDMTDVEQLLDDEVFMSMAFG